MLLQERFLLCDNPDSMPGPGLVLYVYPPFWIGKIVQFKTEDELTAFMVNKKTLVYKCDGYRIGLVIIGGLINAPVSDKVIKPFNEMANFLLEKKILKNAGYYKRYKEEA